MAEQPESERSEEREAQESDQGAGIFVRGEDIVVLGNQVIGFDRGIDAAGRRLTVGRNRVSRLVRERAGIATAGLGLSIMGLVIALVFELPLI